MPAPNPSTQRANSGEISIKYAPHPQQEKIHHDPHRYRVVVAGRRFGKSVFARMEVLMNAIYNPGLYWIISPTYRQGKMIHWIDIKKEVPDELVDNKNENELSITLINGSRIELKGADNENALRGVGLKGVVMDEAAEQKPHIWAEIIRPMLVDNQGFAVFIGTPKGYNWFHDVWLQGKKDSKRYDPQWTSFKFTTYDNPHIDPKEVDIARKETDEDTFAQEYLAEFKRFKGLIYREFSRDLHVIKPFEVGEDLEILSGMDFGFDNPTTCIWVASQKCECGDERWYVVDEYYQSTQTSDYHVGMIKTKDISFGQGIAMRYGDPSATQLLSDYARFGIYIAPARRDPQTNKGEWVGHGIDLLSRKLKLCPINHLPHLFIFGRCENTIREFETYRWEEEKDTQMNRPGRPEKSNDHLMDALRYVAVSWTGTRKIFIHETKKRDWSFK